MTMKNKYIFGFLFLLLMTSCKSIDIDYIKKRMWLWDSGFRIGGDAIHFNEKGDNPEYGIKTPNIILYKGEPKAKIINLNKTTKEMTVVSIETNEKGVYLDSDSFIQ